MHVFTYLPCVYTWVLLTILCNLPIRLQFCEGRVCAFCLFLESHIYTISYRILYFKLYYTSRTHICELIDHVETISDRKNFFYFKMLLVYLYCQEISLGLTNFLLMCPQNKIRSYTILGCFNINYYYKYFPFQDLTNCIRDPHFIIILNFLPHIVLFT